MAQEYLGRRLTPAEFSFLLKDTGVIVHDGDDEDDNAVNTHLDFPRVDVVELAEAIWDRYEIPLIELLAPPCNHNDPAQQELFDFDDPLSF